MTVGPDLSAGSPTAAASNPRPAPAETVNVSAAMKKGWSPRARTRRLARSDGEPVRVGYVPPGWALALIVTSVIGTSRPACDA